ncbi:MAG: 16S rRNA (cytidine(1402)-2'-O)-methyltransferase [Armatimonadetes bacterium]|nr:16S rRNA (cytidine(1402)-2'-O)-methyltransferase [Armatimonadota bacterium]MDE2207196.1 16S rRNA (cytidine(1402)-2'-O)-methyltransferase [Armatimonadota bacterium]
MLILVATPIGNMDDITLRAIEALKQADFVASEDTRKTGMLLKRLGIEARQLAFHEHNESSSAPELLRLAASGKCIAVVSDAGTPCVSDPGFTLVRGAAELGVEVTMVPGPSAVIMAVALSGLPVHSFTFRGFPPRKSGPRRRFFAVDAESPHTLVFFESPHRLAASLHDALAVYGDRPAAILNDLTKKFESVQRGSLSELQQIAEAAKRLGEYVVVIGGSPRASRPPE